MKTVTLYDPTFLATIVLKIGEKDGILSGTVDKEDYKSRGKTFRKYIVWIGSREDFYCLMHECFHLVKKIFEDRDIPFTAENDEVIAYYYSYLFKKLWRTCHRNRK